MRLKLRYGKRRPRRERMDRREAGERLMTSNLIHCMTDRCRYEEEDMPRDIATVQYTLSI